MANTFTSLHFHLTFSTKRRERWFSKEIDERLWGYLGGIAKNHGVVPHAIGGADEHIHVALSMPAKLSISECVQFLKGNSSKWIHEVFPKMRGFAWQDGFGAFSVSKSVLPDVIEYVNRQREHHAKMTFEEEFIALLTKHEVEYDERYVWG
jgi:putative transposase